MNSILITGCNRGLGLGLVKCLLDSTTKCPSHIFATCRNIESAKELKNLAEKYPNVHLLEFDVTDQSNYDRIVNEVSAIVQDKGLNVLFNNAGVMPSPSKIQHVKADDILQTFTVNTLAPIMLTQAFLPLLKQAAKVNGSQPLGVKRAAVINMSSTLGSIEMNQHGGNYCYRVTKAGLNAASRSIWADLKPHGIMCVALHPGWVQTDMGGKHASLDIPTSCTHMINTIYTLKEEQNGCFLNYDGKTNLPW